MTEAENALRWALDDIARLAPDPVRVRQRLNGRLRAHRQRRALIIAGTAAAGAAAVGVPATLWLTRRGTNPVDGNMPTPATEPAHPGNLRVPMRLRPTWLPDDAVEFSRMAVVGAAHQERVWASPAAIDLLVKGDFEKAAAQTVVSLQITRPVPYVAPSPPPTPEVTDPASPPVSPPPFQPLGGPANSTIGGRSARIRTDPNDEITVAWMIDDAGTVATVYVSDIADAATAIVRIARSMVPDGATACETSLRFGYLPPEGSGTDPEVTVDGWSGGWTQVLEVGQNVPGSGSPGARVLLASSRDRLTDLSVLDTLPVATVRGRAGRSGAMSGYAEAVVELDGGRWLQVLSYFGSTDAARVAHLARITESLTIGPDPYLNWIGHR